jgi:hypothetical protein
MPISWYLANPKTGEREVLTTLLDHNHHLIPYRPDPAGRQRFLRQTVQTTHHRDGLTLLRPDRKDQTYRNGNLGGARQ